MGVATRLLGMVLDTPISLWGWLKGPCHPKTGHEGGSANPPLCFFFFFFFPNFFNTFFFEVLFLFLKLFIFQFFNFFNA
jgi:hypothetical protein